MSIFATRKNPVAHCRVNPVPIPQIFAVSRPELPNHHAVRDAISGGFGKRARCRQFARPPKLFFHKLEVWVAGSLMHGDGD